MKTLQEIARGTNTDKEHLHDYMRTYDEVFSPLRHEPIRMLEMGVLGGDSLECWLEYFDHPDTRITGLDIELYRCKAINDPRLTLIEAPQAKIWSNFCGTPFDIIIDDAGHFASDQINCFFECMNSGDILKLGGIYVIEDLHTYASPQHCNAKLNIMEFLCNTITQMQGIGAAASGKVDTAQPFHQIDTITFRRGMAIIRKQRP